MRTRSHHVPSAHRSWPQTETVCLSRARIRSGFSSSILSTGVRAASVLIRCSSSSSCVLAALHLYSCRWITTLCPLTPTHSELPVHSSELICPHVLITNSHFNSTHWHSADLWSDKERKRKSNIRRKKEQEAKWIGPQFWRLTLVCQSVSPLSLLFIKSFLVIWRNCWFQTEINKSSFLF